MPSSANRESPRYWLHRVALGAVALVLAILATSAYLRQSSLPAPCANPPECSTHGIAGSALRGQADGVSAARIIHRLSASAAGAAVLMITFLAWVQTPRARAEIAISAALLALVVFLAALGRFSTTPSPAVTLGNLVGGMALLVLLHWMWLRTATGIAAARLPRSALWAIVAIAAGMVEFALGSMLSASRFAPAPQLHPAKALMLAHSVTGLALLALVAVAALHPATLRSKARPAGLLALTFAVILAGTGSIGGQDELSVAVAVTHNMFAAALLMALATVAHRLRAPPA